jgi:MFS family permease
MTTGAVGLIIMLQPAVQAIVTPFAGRMSDRINPRILTTIGMIMMCLGTAVMITLTIEIVMFKVYLALIFTGLGYALFSTPNTNLILGNVKAKNYTESSGVISVMRQVGMSFSIAIIMCMMSVTMGTTSNILGMENEFITAVRYAFAICFMLAAAGAFLTWFSNDDKPSPDQCISNH